MARYNASTAIRVESCAEWGLYRALGGLCVLHQGVVVTEEECKSCFDEKLLRSQINIQMYFKLVFKQSWLPMHAMTVIAENKREIPSVN